MASIWRHPNSKYWTACYTAHLDRDLDGRALPRLPEWLASFSDSLWADGRHLVAHKLAVQSLVAARRDFESNRVTSEGFKEQLRKIREQLKVSL